MLEAGEIDDFTDHHPMNRVHFKVYPKQFDNWFRKGEKWIEDKLKLSKSISMANLVLYNHDDKLYRYNSEIDIMEEFFQRRLGLYTDRKEYLLKKLMKDYEMLSNKARFIKEVVEDELQVRRVKKKDLVQTMKQRGYKTQTELNAIFNEDANKPIAVLQNEQNQEQADEDEIGNAEYDYLLKMPILSLTLELVEQIEQQKKDKKAEHEALLGKRIEDIWKEDIEAFLAALDKYEEQEEAERLEDEGNSGNNGGKRKKRPQKPVKTGGKKANNIDPPSARGRGRGGKEPNSARSNQAKSKKPINKTT